MSVRKLLLVCVLAVVTMVPLVGCKGSTTTKPVGGGTTPAKTSNTTDK
jgi:hypothetical protein